MLRLGTAESMLRLGTAESMLRPGTAESMLRPGTAESNPSYFWFALIETMVLLGATTVARTGFFNTI
jgi:hypothetical protein